MSEQAEVQKQVKRLEQVRQEVERINQQRNRLAGKIESCNGRLKGLEEECKKKFGVTVVELPTTIAEMEKDAEEALQEAERLLKG